MLAWLWRTPCFHQIVIALFLDRLDVTIRAKQIARFGKEYGYRASKLVEYCRFCYIDDLVSFHDVSFSHHSFEIVLHAESHASRIITFTVHRRPHWLHFDLHTYCATLYSYNEIQTTLFYHCWQESTWKDLRFWLVASRLLGYHDSLGWWLHIVKAAWSICCCSSSTLSQAGECMKWRFKAWDVMLEFCVILLSSTR